MTALPFTFFPTGCLLRTYNITGQKIAADWTRTNADCIRRVQPSRDNTLSYLRLRQRTTLSQHPSVEAELASHTPKKINDFYPCFNFKLSECIGVFG
jgi:hypothetical protein